MAKQSVVGLSWLLIGSGTVLSMPSNPDFEVLEGRDSEPQREALPSTKNHLKLHNKFETD